MFYIVHVNSNLKFEFNRDKKTPEVINVALSVCGDNVTLCNLSTNMLKTAFLFTEKPVRFIIFANELSQEFISKKVLFAFTLLKRYM